MSTEAVLLSESEWRQRQAAHRERVLPWVEPRLRRRMAGRKHPTDDFLFDYYPYSVNKLLTWHPGHGVTLTGVADDFLAHPAYVRTDAGVTTRIDWLEGKHDRLDVAIAILEGTQSREPVVGCFALHEWAMVYGLDQEQVRHRDYPMRLSPLEIRDTVDAIGLRCTHIDAYRFFTDEATPLNSLAPTRQSQPSLEQPGCLHAAMDLYKYAMWFSPLVGSDLIADCFELARSSRNLDMQASPYDVAYVGLEPIAVETPEGRREFARRQREVMADAEPLRARLLDELRVLSSRAGSPPDRS